MVLDDTSDEHQIVIVDGSSETDGYSDIGGERTVGAVVLHAGVILGPGPDDQGYKRSSGCAFPIYNSGICHADEE